MTKRKATKGNGLRVAAIKAQAQSSTINPIFKQYPIKPPDILPGVVPKNVKTPAVAMDYNPCYDLYRGTDINACVIGFPGFSYLSMLASRAEYRAFASTLATEITREWIEFTSQEDDDTETNDKIKLIEEEFVRLNVRGIIGEAVIHDCFFGRAQIFIEIKGADRKTPLIIDPRTVPKGSFVRLSTVEAIWTTPKSYNALDPAAADFYKPTDWFMLGQQVHASRLMTIITREMPDILKPAFNFAGISLSQLAEAYVDNWLRTRQSVSDLINNFSIVILKTAMGQVLQGDDDGEDLMKRADLFTAARSNKGMMLLDKDTEELEQIAVPLGGLSDLQAQAQEHMCTVSRLPAVILTGLSPTGLNASSEGEIRVHYDWIAAQQEAYWRKPLETILKLVQLNLFGEIDNKIGFKFVPLYQMTEKEEAEIRTATGATDVSYITAGVVAPEEVRDKLAKDPLSGYQGINVGDLPEPPVPLPGEKPPGEDDNGDKD